jgi:hypothetical protein
VFLQTWLTAGRVAYCVQCCAIQRHSKMAP